MKKDVWRLAWPAVLEMILHMVVGLVDVAIAGRINSAAVGGVAIASQIVWFTAFVINGLSAGAAALVARATGAKQFHLAAQAALGLIYSFITLGIIINFLGYTFSGPIISLFNVDNSTRFYALQYMNIAWFSIPFFLLWLGNSRCLRAAGYTRLPLIIAVIANSINVVAAIILGLGLGHWPGLGVRGTAIAALIAMFFGAFLTAIALERGLAGFKVNFFARPQWEIIKKIWQIGVPALGEELVFQGSRWAQTYLLVRLGTTAFAANEVAMSVESLSFMPGYGFAIAAEALAGQYLGEKKPELARRAVQVAMEEALKIMGGFALLFLLMPEMLASLFTSYQELILLAAICIRLAALEQPGLAMEMTIAGGLRGMGNTRFPLLVTLMGNWLIRLPLLAFEVYKTHWGLMGVWIITALDWSLRALLLRFRLNRPLQEQAYVL
ncbi:MAG: MATE family efflux transporter [Bacillota bacterium]